MRFCKTSLLLCVLFSFSACTPDINRSLNKSWQGMVNYNYEELFDDVTGYKRAFPNTKEAMILQDRELCVHEDAHEREVTVNGINDKIMYHYCTLTPAPAVTLKRFEGK